MLLATVDMDKQGLLLSKAETRRAGGLVEDGKDALEEDVAEDGETDAGVGLDATEARSAGVVDGSIVDVAAWNNKGLASDGDVECWPVLVARSDVAALLAVISGTRDLGVVGRDSL